MQLSDYEQNSLNKLGNSIHEGNWSTEGMVQLIELVGSYLNIASIASYARQQNMSYNGVKKHRNVRKIFDTKYVIDNN